MGGALEELADVLYDFPKEYALIFDAVHYVLCLLAVRADMGEEFDRVSTQHPFVSLSWQMQKCCAVVVKDIKQFQPKPRDVGCLR